MCVACIQEEKMHFEIWLSWYKYCDLCGKPLTLRIHTKYHTFSLKIRKSQKLSWSFTRPGGCWNRNICYFSEQKASILHNYYVFCAYFQDYWPMVGVWFYCVGSRCIPKKVFGGGLVNTQHWIIHVSIINGLTWHMRRIFNQSFNYHHLHLENSTLSQPWKQPQLIRALR